MWKVYAVCECGWQTVATHGSKFFSDCDYPCCPDCGRSPSARTLKTRRWVPRQKVVVEGHWEDWRDPSNAGGEFRRDSDVNSTALLADSGGDK